MKPRLLDLFCGAGGAAMGYHRAGFEVVGVDIKPQPHYPFEFHQADAMTYPIEGFDVIHASPPCQGYTVANNIWNHNHPRIIPDVRARLKQSGAIWVIENVESAPLDGITLCGLSFGLGVKRHRLFESNRLLLTMPCGNHFGDWVSIFGHSVLERSPAIGRTLKNGPIYRRRHLGIDRGRQAMGIDWMTSKELSEAIPPIYCEFIGKQLLAAIETK